MRKTLMNLPCDGACSEECVQQWWDWVNFYQAAYVHYFRSAITGKLQRLCNDGDRAVVERVSRMLGGKW